MHAETLPPFRRVSSRNISVEDGSEMLEKYLKNSELHPHLHPDSLITTGGTTFSGQGGPMGGVVMHNLRRVAAALQGNYLEPEPTPEPEGGERRDQHTAAFGTTESQDEVLSQRIEATIQDDWQTMSEYEREEGMIEVEEVEQRSNFVQQNADLLELDTVGGAEQLKGEGKKRKKDDGVKLDKEARKKAKKAKDKEFRAKKEKARAEAST